MIPVMIVEDEFLVRIGLKSMIDWNSYGFYVVADAADGSEGLVLYQQHHPYLIITDIRMSPMTGLDMMREIRNMDSDVKFIIISAYNDFEYAQQAISYGVELYLNKSTFRNEDFAQVLPKIRLSYHYTNSEQTLSNTGILQNFDTVFPDITDVDKINAKLEEHNLAHGIRYLLASRFDRSQKRALASPMAYTILQDLMKKSQIPCCFYTRKDFLLGICQTDNPELLMNISQEAHNTLVNYTMSSYYFGISAVFKDNQRLSRALSEACLACNEFIMNKEIICRCFSTQNTVLNYGSLNLDTSITELMSAVFSSNVSKTLSVLEEIIFSCRNYRSLERALFAVLSTFIEYDDSGTLSALLEKYLKKDDSSEIILSIKKWIFSLPFNTAPQGTSSNDYTDEVITYIGAHLDENLSIQTLASRVHLSPNYLGKLFYQKTGTFINQYINNCRINKACELLLKTDHAINTIGVMVGIHNPHYFSRLFKDTMGISPSQYRTQPQDIEKE